MKPSETIKERALELAEIDWKENKVDNPEDNVDLNFYGLVTIVSTINSIVEYLDNNQCKCKE